jgi:hypothetical protein
MDLVGFFDLLSALFVLLICFFTADLSVVVLAGLHSDSVGPQRGPGPSDFEGARPKLAGSALEGSQKRTGSSSMYHRYHPSSEWGPGSRHSGGADN